MLRVSRASQPYSTENNVEGLWEVRVGEDLRITDLLHIIEVEHLSTLDDDPLMRVLWKVNEVFGTGY